LGQYELVDGSNQAAPVAAAGTAARAAQSCVRKSRATFSAIAMVVSIVTLDGGVGMIDASATLRLETPRTAPVASTTACGSLARAHAHGAVGVVIEAHACLQNRCERVRVVADVVAGEHLAPVQRGERLGAGQPACQADPFDHRSDVPRVVEQVDVNSRRNTGVRRDERHSPA